MKRHLRKIALALGSFVTLVLATAVIMASMYEDEISRYAVTELEGKLISDMQIGDINLSLLAHFPKASLQCRNVLIMDTFDPSDTLLYAKKLSLKFSIFDFLDGSYVVDEVNIEGANVRLLRAETGEVNYIFWNDSQSESPDSMTFKFELEKVHLANSKFCWHDARSQVDLDFVINQATLSGVIEGEKTSVVASLDLNDALVKVNDIAWVNHSAIEGDLELAIESGTETYIVRKSDLEIAGMELHANGRFQSTDDVVFCVLDANAKGLDIAKARAILPTEVTNFLEGYLIKGKADVVFAMKGAAGGGQQPEVDLSATIHGASLQQIATDVALTDIYAETSYHYSDSDELTIHKCEAKLEGNEVRANGAIAHLGSPWMNLHLEGDLDLNDVKQFAGLTDLSTLEGESKFSLNYKGALRNWEFNADDLQRAESSGQVSFENCELQLEGSEHVFEELTGTMMLNNGDATIQSLTGICGESDFRFQGVFKDLLAWGLTDQMLHIEAGFFSENLNLTEWLSDSDGIQTTNEAAYHLAFPESIAFDLQIKIDQLQFRKFDAKSVKGIAQFKDGQLHLDPVTFETAEGSFNGNLVAKARPNGFLITSKAWLDHMNVNSLFKEFENFGQDFIQDKHIKGRCSAQATFSAMLSPSLEVDPKSIVSVIDLKIENGELIELQSMNSICNYLRTNKVVAPLVDIDALQERLQHIAFNTLENQIDIRNERIHFPNMEIHSSAMDITTSGTHFFDNQIDYSLGFYLRDLLIQKNESSFGEVEDDGLGNRFFLSMTGTVDKPEFGYDRLAHKEQRKQDREEEKKEFMQLLKDEFGLFRKRDDQESGDKPLSSPNGTPETTIQVTLPDDGTAKPKDEMGIKKLFGKKGNEKEGTVPPPADDDDF